jgi:TRAP-type C4-dicarboxylate transport system permease large subunit
MTPVIVGSIPFVMAMILLLLLLALFPALALWLPKLFAI